MGQFISQFDTNPKLFGDYELEDYQLRRHSWLPEQTKEARDSYEEYSQYSSVTTTVFVVVMIVLLLVLLICCIKTVMVCRRQKRVNDQRRRMMQRRSDVEQSLRPYFEPTAYTMQHALHLPGSGIPQMFMPENVYSCDEPPAYDQVIGLPPSYDSIVILNGVQSRGASVVGSVRNSVIGTVRSLRRSSRAAIQCGSQGQTDSVITSNSSIIQTPSEIGSSKSESLVESIAHRITGSRYPMSEPDDTRHSEPKSRSSKSLRRNKSSFSLPKSVDS